MKTAIFLTCFLFTNSFLHSDIFKITPVSFDIIGVEINKNFIYAYGEAGSLLISSDKGVNWTQERAFTSGKIIQILSNGNVLVAFNDRGVIGISEDNGKTWLEKIDLKDSILAAITFPDGFLVRCKNKILTLNREIEIISQQNLYSEFIGSCAYQGYRYSMSHLKQWIIVDNGNGEYFRYGYDLTPIDTIKLKELGICSKCSGRFQMCSNDDYAYLIYDYKLFRTKDFKLIKKITDSNYLYCFRIIDNELYYIEYSPFYYNSLLLFNLKLYKIADDGTILLINEFINEDVTHALVLNDFTIQNEMAVFVGNRKFVGIAEFNHKKMNVVSDCSGFTRDFAPILIKDSTYILFSGYDYGVYNKFIYTSINNGITFYSLIGENKDYDKLHYCHFAYFDETAYKIYMLGEDRNQTFIGLFTSNDLCKTFNYKQVERFPNAWSGQTERKTPIKPNTCVSGGNFIAANNSKFRNVMYNSLLTYNSDFDLVTFYRDSNFYIDYIFESKDTNSFFIHCLNMPDVTFDIRFTEDKGKTWNIVKKYHPADSLFRFQEIVANGDKQVIVYYTNNTDSTCGIDAVNSRTKEVRTIYKYKIRDYSVYGATMYNAAEYGDGNFYLAINDTLFYGSEIFDRCNWKYHILPNNGRIIRNFKKLGNRFYARYLDNFNIDNLYWIEIVAEQHNEPPIILAGDADFGAKDISDSSPDSIIVKLSNLSDKKMLEIYNYSYNFNNVFSTDLPAISENEPLRIMPKEFFAFKVYFKPLIAQKYFDTITFVSNAISEDPYTLMFGEGIDTATSVSESEVNTSYLYAYPPRPMPASNEVRSLVYWDTNHDIDDAEIAVYDIFGKKVAGRESVSIIKEAAFKGWLSWNCSTVPNGVYLIHLRHGSISRTIKAMVNR